MAGKKKAFCNVNPKKNGAANEKKSAGEWNRKKLLYEQREAWSEHVNQTLEKARVEARVDHRSWEAKGIEREPKIHLGWYANNLEKQGIASELGNINRDIDELNRLTEKLQRLKQQEAKLTEEIRKEKEREKEAEKVAYEAAKQREAKYTTADKQKELLKHLLDQQRDRERGKPRSEDSKTLTKKPNEAKPLLTRKWKTSKER